MENAEIARFLNSLRNICVFCLRILRRVCIMRKREVRT